MKTMTAVSAPQDLRSLLPGVVLAAVLAAATGWFVFSYGYVEDDAYIHLEFARSVAEGRGFAFNGRVTNGDTAPLWPLMVAAIHALGFGWVASAKVACVAGLSIAVTGTWQLVKDLTPAGSRQPLLPLAAVLITVINPFFVHWSFSGMESVTALGLSFWAIRTVFLGDTTAARALLGASLLAVGPLLRPELLLLGAVAGPVLLWRSWQAGAGEPAAHRVAKVALLAVIMVLPLGLWCGYAYEAFGTVVPNTNVAKRGGTVSELAPRLLSVYLLGFPVTLAMLPFGVLPRLRRWQAPMAVSVLLLWPLACIAFYLADHTLVQTRYCLLSMPAMSIGILWLTANSPRPLLFQLTCAAMLLVSLATIGLIVVPHVSNKKRYGEVLSSASMFLREQIPPADPVAVYAIGQIAFESRHPLVDTGGITQPSVIPFMADQRATLSWAKSQGARYIITGEKPEPGAQQVFAAPVPYLGWSLHYSAYQALSDYTIYKLP
jgi:hypothetical protein